MCEVRPRIVSRIEAQEILAIVSEDAVAGSHEDDFWWDGVSVVVVVVDTRWSMVDDMPRRGMFRR